ncbi:hypothetical protein PSTT_14222 [Puccinia striiformis]|uniref:Uncharacterized protein n=1 Tax=Puccinia striiformis TaxID=27350 RepID=A0A2S4UN59_9BASI|nr:hypothetical protein PSTT_14222 [Puccinia striiformis]
MMIKPRSHRMMSHLDRIFILLAILSSLIGTLYAVPLELEQVTHNGSEYWVVIVAESPKSEPEFIPSSGQLRCGAKWKSWLGGNLERQGLQDQNRNWLSTRLTQGIDLTRLSTDRYGIQ